MHFVVQLPKLRYLELSHIRDIYIDKEDIIRLCKCLIPSSIRELALIHIGCVDDSVLEHLVGIKKHEFLYLEGSPVDITPKGLEVFEDTLINPEVKYAKKTQPGRLYQII